MNSIDQRLDKVIADWQERALASLPIEEVAAMYRRMKAEQAREKAAAEARASLFGLCRMNSQVRLDSG